MRRFGCFIGLMTLAAAVLPAAPAEFPADRFRRAQIRPLETPGDLESAFRALLRQVEGPAWIGYAVPRIARASSRSVYDDGKLKECGVTYLERGRHSTEYRSDHASSELLVLFRLEAGEVRRIRALGDDCDIAAGGLDVHAFASVEMEQSLELLVSLTEAERSFANDSLMAVALHDHEGSDEILDRIARGDLDWGHANQAVFWLGAARGQRGFEILSRLMENEADADLRHHITFGFYVSRNGAAVDALIRAARHDESRKVRRQALFWLGQEASQRSIDELDRTMEEDPDLEIKEYAVFSLSQLPAEKGVPLLIRHARTHPEPTVRKKAIFWLGQSGDERALDFFEEILLDD